MQTKNVNLLQANSSATVEAPLADPSSSSSSSEAVVKMTNGSAPPLPPRGNTQGPPSRPKSIMHMQLDAGVFSPYKPVPLPKPVPPPYRQPPQVPIYSNPSVPGTMQPSTSTEALNMHFPIKRKTQVLVEEDEAELDCGETSAAVAGGCDVRIPTLAEVVKMKPRPKSANVVRPVERPSKPKAQQAWTEDNIEKQTCEGGGTKQRKLVVADDDRWEGEPLLVRSRSGPLYPCGIDNQGADDIGYVPSQPHQKNAGARGQVLLEGCGGEPDSAAQDNLYRAFCVTTEVDTVVRGPETSELSIRDACSRMYPSAKTIHSSLQNLKVSSSMEQPEVKRQRPKMRISTAEGVEVGPTQPYYHLKDMRSGEDEGKVYNRVSQATKDEVEGVVVYGATKVLGAVELCARSPAQQGNPATTKAVAESKRMSSTSSESGHGTMQTGAPSSGTLNTSSESAPTNTNHVETSKEKKAESFNLNESSFSDHFSVTPPLPPLSPSTTPPTSPRTHPTKHKRRTPDIVETTRDVGNMRLSANRKANSSSKGVKSSSGLNHSDFRSWINKQGRLYVQGQSRSSTSPYKYSGRSQRIPLGGRVSVDTNDGEVTSTTTGLDLDSLLDEAEMSSVNSSTTDDASQSTSIAEIGSIRKQLESLEGMYSEVMRVLGLQNGLPPRLKGGQETKFKKNFASSPASSTTTTTTAKGHVSSKAPVGGRMGSSKTSDRHLQSERGKRVKEKGIGKRFQRLESHVVTLARSVAHLSSEMRTQHMMFQELENLRQEVAQLHDAQLLLRSRVGQGTNAAAAAANGRGGNNGGSREWDNFRSSIPSLTNPSRVKKLTHFFGDEPPLLRLFLKKLGYEKYACLFESEKIGIIELPYLTEERLQKIGIPMGPRMRILQEAQMSFRQEHFNIYIV